MLPMTVASSLSVQETRRQRFALATLLLGAVMIGFAPIFVRLSEVGPIATAFHRMLLALPFFVLWRLGDRTETAQAETTLRADAVSAREHRTNQIYAAIAGANFGLDLIFYHWSLSHVSVANATLLSNLAPIFVTLIAWLWWGERVHAKFVGCLILAIAGVWILVLGDGRAAAIGGSQTGLGTAQGAASAVFYAGYIVTMKRARRSLSLTAAMLISSAVTVVVLLPLSLALGETFWPQTLAGWAVLVGLAWVAQGLGQGMIAKSLSVLPASFSSLTLLVQPVVAALLAWMLLGEALTWLQFAGGVLVLLGVYMARR